MATRKCGKCSLTILLLLNVKFPQKRTTFAREGLRHLFEPERACSADWRVPKARPAVQSYLLVNVVRGTRPDTQ